MIVACSLCEHTQVVSVMQVGQLRRRARGSLVAYGQVGEFLVRVLVGRGKSVALSRKLGLHMTDTSEESWFIHVFSGGSVSRIHSAHHSAANKCQSPQQCLLIETRTFCGDCEFQTFSFFWCSLWCGTS